MAIKISDKEKDLVRVIKQMIGCEVTNVIRAYQDGPRPQYPYLTISSDTTKTKFGSPQREGVDENDNIYYDIPVMFPFRITCIGKGSQDILWKVKGLFERREVRDLVKLEMQGVLSFTDDVRYVPSLPSAEFVEQSFMEIKCSFLDRVLEVENCSLPLGHPIEAVETTGEIKRGEDDINPIQLNITVDERED